MRWAIKRDCLGNGRLEVVLVGCPDPQVVVLRQSIAVAQWDAVHSTSTDVWSRSDHEHS